MSSIGGCDDTDAVDVRKHTVDLMSYIKWCDVLKSGSDVIERMPTQPVVAASFSLSLLPF